MAKVVWTDEAERSLLKIHDYIARDKPGAAFNVVQSIYARARILSTRGSKRGATWSTLCRLAKKLPGVEAGTCYGTPALRVRKKFLARLKEDGQTVALRVDFLDRDVLLELDPAAFYLTDHYRPYPAMLVRLKQVRLDLLQQLLEQAWRRQAPKSLVAKASESRAGAAVTRRHSTRSGGQ